MNRRNFFQTALAEMNLRPGRELAVVALTGKFLGFGPIYGWTRKQWRLVKECMEKGQEQFDNPPKRTPPPPSSSGEMS